MYRTNQQLKDMARGMLLGRYGVFMVAFLLTTLIPSMILAPFEYLSEGQDQVMAQRIIWWIVNVIVYMIQMLLQTGLLHMHFINAYGFSMRSREIFWVLKHKPDRILIGSLLFGLMEVVPFLPAVATAFWMEKSTAQIAMTVFLGIFGALLSLYLVFRYALVFILYAQNESMDTQQAFRMSAGLMEGQKLRLLSLYLSFIGWGLLGILTLGIGFLWIVPYMTQTMMNFYIDLVHGFDVRVEIRQKPGDCMENN